MDIIPWIYRFIPSFTDLDHNRKTLDDWPREFIMSMQDRLNNYEAIDCERFKAKHFKDFLDKSDKFINEIQDIM